MSKKKYEHDMTRLKDLQILVKNSKSTLEHYATLSDMVDETVIENQKNLIKHWETLLRAKEKEVVYNKKD